MANRFLIVCGGSGYKLLGQRSILGIDAELQIDVSQETISKDWKIKDDRSLYIDLDKRVGTTAVALNSMLKGMISKNGQSKPEAIKHLQILIDKFPASRPLEFGLSQSPAIGKAAIAHEYNKDLLSNAFQEMLSKFGTNIGPANPIEVWIVSSTAGGTGEGTHRFVADVLADLCARRTDTPLTMNFIRIGPLTYRSVNEDKTSLNTFFGVSADSAFMLQIKEKYPLAVTNWFYMDLPNVGMGKSAKSIRGEIVEMACKAVMLPDLQEDIQKLLVNNLGSPIVLVRTGYWGKDFGNQQKYFETLKQLVVKLQNFVTPNYERVYISGKPQPEFIAPELDLIIGDAQNTNYVLSRIEKSNWRFPNYRFSGIPKNIDTVRTSVSDWQKSIDSLIERKIDQLNVEYRVDEENDKGNGNRRSVPLTVYENIEDNIDWFARIADTHRVKGWTRQLLGINHKDGAIQESGLISELLKLADQLSKIYNQIDLFSSSNKKAEKTASILGQFIRILVQVDFLLDLERSATRLLDKELINARKVLQKADDELDIVKNTMNTSPTTMIYAADLWDVLDTLAQKSWLHLLQDAVHKGDQLQFRQEVLKGATGLTEEGLKYVLSLQANNDIVDIQNALDTHVGRMVDGNGNEYQGEDWQATPPSATLQYFYRILPQVNRNLSERLNDRANRDGKAFHYVFTKFGMIGLYVLAFHGISLTKNDGDTLTAPTFLLRPFVRLVKEILSENNNSMQFELCTAGCIGEPLDKNAMLEAGLSDEEVAIIGEFYELYSKE